MMAGKFKEDRYRAIEEWKPEITAFFASLGCEILYIEPMDLGCQLVVRAKTNLPAYTDEEWDALPRPIQKAPA